MTREELEYEADRLLMEDEDILDRSDSEAIACKIGHKEKEAFRRLCEEKLGCTMNDALQMCIDMLRRYMEDRYNLSDELQQMINLFEGFNNWGHKDNKNRGHFNLAEPLDRGLVLSAIYIIGSKFFHGHRLVLVEGAHDEMRYETFNVQTILETFIENYDERLYRELRRVGAAMGCRSLDEILRRLVSEYHAESEDDKELRRMFEDNRRSEYGHEDLPEGGPYRRTMHYDPDEQSARIAEWERKHQTTIDFGWTEEDQIKETF